MKRLVKKIVQCIPAMVGKRLSVVGFQYRLGGAYLNYRESLKSPPTERDIFHAVKSLVESSVRDIEFYRVFYARHGFSSEQLNTFADLVKIPIVTKADLQEFDFNARTTNAGSGTITNTGGTSGQPLMLLLDGAAHAREWAHMHTVWEQLGYKTSSIKITLRGMNLGDQPIKYNFIHNEFQVNAYCEFDRVAEALAKVLARYKVEYVHGYPSGIYEFIKQLDGHYPELLQTLKANLKGVLFGSEFPAPVYRDYIEASLGVATLSWYGHTEMAVLAREKDQPFVYHPFQSYGFTEAVEIEGQCHLVGTTIHNNIGPLIRYDTGDIIEPVSFDQGLLASFRISQGRVGEFVVDTHGRNISLTALIFGRHHTIFERADFIQVKQLVPGELTVYVTSKDKDLDCRGLFDAQGIHMALDFQVVSSPFKTTAGKVPLLLQ